MINTNNGAHISYAKTSPDGLEGMLSVRTDSGTSDTASILP